LYNQLRPRKLEAAAKLALRLTDVIIMLWPEAGKGVHQIIKAGAKLRQIISEAGCGVRAGAL